MIVVNDTLSRADLKSMAAAKFKDAVNAVVDVRRGVMAVDAERHADLEHMLMEIGSSQKDIWGINLHPDAPADGLIQFNAKINVRPSQGNHSLNVESAELRQAIKEIVAVKIVG